MEVAVFKFSADMTVENVCKIGLSPFEKNYMICYDEKSFKRDENCFYIILKALEILVNTRIAIFYLPGCDVIDFETNLVFLIKPFSYTTKKKDKNLNILRSEKAFKVK